MFIIQLERPCDASLKCLISDFGDLRSFFFFSLSFIVYVSEADFYCPIMTHHFQHREVLRRSAAEAGNFSFSLAERSCLARILPQIKVLGDFAASWRIRDLSQPQVIARSHQIPDVDSKPPPFSLPPRQPPLSSPKDNFEVILEQNHLGSNSIKLLQGEVSFLSFCTSNPKLRGGGGGGSFRMLHAPPPPAVIKANHMTPLILF